MPGPKKTLADAVLSSLDEETIEHFNYNKLFLNNVKRTDKDAVSNFLQQEYLGGKTPEEFALAHIMDGIGKDMSKFTVKKKGSEPST